MVDDLLYEPSHLFNFCHFQASQLFQVSVEMLKAICFLLPAVSCLLIFGSFEAIVMAHTRSNTCHLLHNGNRIHNKATDWIKQMV